MTCGDPAWIRYHITIGMEKGEDMWKHCRSFKENIRYYSYRAAGSQQGDPLPHRRKRMKENNGSKHVKTKSTKWHPKKPIGKSGRPKPAVTRVASFYPMALLFEQFSNAWVLTSQAGLRRGNLEPGYVMKCRCGRNKRRLGGGSTSQTIGFSWQKEPQKWRFSCFFLAKRSMSFQNGVERWVAI